MPYPLPHTISTEIRRNFLTIESVMLCSASFDDCDLCSNIVLNRECEILKSHVHAHVHLMFMNAWPYYVINQLAVVSQTVAKQFAASKTPPLLY